MLVVEQLLEKAAKAATKTHKERVEEFNSKLEALSEHYDIPKVSRGGPGPDEDELTDGSLHRSDLVNRD
jgi:hypothetical protein